MAVAGQGLRRLVAAAVQQPRWLLAACVLLAVVQALGLLHSTTLAQIDRALQDQQLRLLAPRVADPRIAIIDIDERSLAEHGRWPWRRALLADLLDRATVHEGARLVGLDLVLAEADRSADLAALDVLLSRQPGPLRDDAALRAAITALRPQLDDDARLAEVLRRSPVVLGFHLSDEAGTGRSGVLPPALLPADLLGDRADGLLHWAGHGGNLAGLQAAAGLGAGHLNALIDSDGLVRRVPLLVRVGNGVYGALALVMARAWLADAPANPGTPPLTSAATAPTPPLTGRPAGAVGLAFEPASGRLQALQLLGPGGRLRVPVDAQAVARVPYLGPGVALARHSAADVLAGRLPANALRGKLVLIGVSAAGLIDQRATPVDQALWGTLVHAQLLSGLLDGRVQAAPAQAGWIEAATLLLLGGLLVWALPVLALWQGALLCTGLIALVLLGQVITGQVAGLVLPLASSLLLPAALLVMQWLLAFGQSSAARRALAQRFGQYVPPELVQQMSHDPGRYSMQGRSAEMSVLFADVQGFSGLAEHKPPGELGEMMNLVFSHLTEAIRAQRGTLDKYIGDAVMAFWGAPLDDADHARHAVQAALAMQQCLPALHDEMAARGWPALRLGIGVNSGEMVVGDMGSRHRLAYTVMGDAVNLAARLQALCSAHGLGLVVGDSTRAALGDQLCLSLGDVRVRGRSAPVPVWHPLRWRRGQDAAADRLAASWHHLNLAIAAGQRAEADTLITALATDPALAALCAWQRGRLEPPAGPA